MMDLSLPQTLTFCLLTALVYRFGVVCYRIYFSPLRKHPGPWYFAASHIPKLFYFSIKGTWHLQCKKLHEQYGDIIRVGPSEISCIHPDAWKDIYGHKPSGRREFGKCPSQRMNAKQFESNILTSSQENHRRQRRLLSRAFSEQALSRQYPILKHHVDVLIQKLSDRARGEDGAVDVVQLFNFVAFDLLGDLAFGKRFGCLENSSYHFWVEILSRNIGVGGWFQILNQYSFLKRLVPIVMPGRMKKRREYQQFAAEMTHMRIEAGVDAQQDFMSFLLKPTGGKVIGHQELQNMSEILILAGSETTAAALSGLFYLLVTHPQKYRRLQQEIRNTFSDEERVESSSVGDLKYLTACIQEGLRMYPPLPTGTRRVAPQGGDYVGGEYIPEGTSISIPHFAAFRSSENFAQPNCFIPERWLEDTENSVDRKLAFQPFSFGPRNCIGQSLALLEMRLIVARIMWKFDLALDPECESWLEHRAFIFWSRPPLNIHGSLAS